MRIRGRQVVLILTALLALSKGAVAQVTVGDELNLNLNGTLSFGYADSNSSLMQSSHSLSFGGQAQLNGSYHDPRFLSFSIVPYYNESRADSNVQSVFDASGIFASANIFGGSRTPGFISFVKGYNHEGEFGIPGAANYRTRGNNQNFEVSWSFLEPHLPSVTVGYGVGNSEYEILGTNGVARTDLQNFSLHSNYLLGGFNLNAGFVHTQLSQHLPIFTLNNGQLLESNDQNSYQLAASRHFGRLTSLSATATRSDASAQFYASPTRITVDTVTANFLTTPAHNFVVGINGAYTDNWEGSVILGTVSPNGGILPIIPGQSSHSVDLLGTASYGLRRSYDFSVQGSIEHRQQAFEGLSLRSESYRGSINYGHPLWGGTLGIYGGAIHYTIDLKNQSSIGTADGVSYSRRFGLWSANASARYSQDEQTVIVSYKQSGYGYSGGLSRSLQNWHWNLNATGNKTTIRDGNHAAASSQSYSTTLSRGIVNFTGGYSQSSGDSFLTGSGLVPVPVPVIPPSLLITYGGTGYSGAVGLRPMKGLAFTADYVHSRYQTLNGAQNTRNLLNEFDVKADYYYRQMHFLAGYTRLNQSFSGTVAGTPYILNMVYFGVSRGINFF